MANKVDTLQTLSGAHVLNRLLNNYYHDTHGGITSVKRSSAWVSTAILVQLKCFIAERNAGAIICRLNVFLKKDLNRLLSLSSGDLDA